MPSGFPAHQRHGWGAGKKTTRGLCGLSASVRFMPHLPCSALGLPTPPAPGCEKGGAWGEGGRGLQCRREGVGFLGAPRSS